MEKDINKDYLNTTSDSKEEQSNLESDVAKEDMFDEIPMELENEVLPEDILDEIEVEVPVCKWSFEDVEYIKEHFNKGDSAGCTCDCDNVSSTIADDVQPDRNPEQTYDKGFHDGYSRGYDLGKKLRKIDSKHHDEKVNSAFIRGIVVGAATTLAAVLITVKVTK